MFVEKKLLRNFDYTLLITVLIIIVFGLVILSSATHITAGKGDDPFGYVKKQLLWVIIGFISIAIVLRINYNSLSNYARYLYILNILLLLLVPVMGKESHGAKLWIPIGPFLLQPGEFAKLFIIITFANYLDKKQGKLERFVDLIPCFIHVGIPMLLIMAQPDLGTALVFIGILFGMLFIGGARPLHLLIVILIGALLVGIVLFGQLQLGWDKPLKPYQLKRLTIFVDPYQDPREAGYHVIQSQVALGSGGLFGKGLYHGTQNQLNFLPEQQTDFIFSVVGEELGFAGAASLLLLFFILVYRGVLIGYNAKDMFGTLIATGIVSMITFHLLVNVGMAAGIMPITGIPLPLFSYGGSAMLTNLTAIGLLLNVNLRREKIMF
ncbi:rod shape-determining protein RodA [Thermincola ferriacetica]|uniref:Peptidoglycan glycosyltransferase RodA n=1 Tax=Thermincola ferriacetica TaxID=281456 RepID=A0A0L6W1Z5_9FIRM|nr:rod shape-determining protein RodA [Thermincola ferriacetica]KNZ69560.1 rod shape-determining protein RodA [Thermincola ferriacetica]